ncbi:MAG: hypothetical protein HC849_29175 [Oscillatoriales cyanobacterium RU_3_3]|nr:hypothetical protein [Microcoleus sp. SM1_3_4]NJM63321.1 hypothetical protein [Oscillatoriales cyanobacterium RU_3_3]NJR23060.1 hypothetical protein [Richelia sp. CSU_2_1]NJS41837.1 hypothetical protein [Candidatus Gracilibacteria bacterium]
MVLRFCFSEFPNRWLLLGIFAQLNFAAAKLPVNIIPLRRTYYQLARDRSGKKKPDPRP